MASDPGTIRKTGEQLDMALAHFRARRMSEAVEACRKVLALEPDVLPALGTMAEALAILGEHEEAAACYRRIIELRPNLGLAHYNLGNALLVLGRLDEARAAFERAVALMPRDAAAHRALSSVKTYSSGDPQIAVLEALEKGETFLPDLAKAELHFALAKVGADLGRHEQSFAHLEKANRTMRRLVRYDEGAELDAMRDMAAVFTPEVMRAKAGQGDPSPVPIFVVGMPRSGTTLVERVLASHPDVFGAGELAAFGDVAAGGYAPTSFNLEELTAERLHEIGSRYLTQIRAKAPDARHIVDKMPANFRFAGLIHLALPNARIIHVRRDPVDTCFSCYAQLFVHSQNFSYDLEELGRYYNAYTALMAHWENVLPADAMLEVQYEDLVGDFEAQAKRLIAFCGLEWNHACLNFHEAPGAIRTASAAQARQPLYRSSVGRAQKYETALAPLRAILKVEP